MTATILKKLSSGKKILSYVEAPKCLLSVHAQNLTTVTMLYITVEQQGKLE
jgi:hypothetical protein